MQKKSLLVALFCGALCLTGCLKNEESASVALVRGAKAEELKSLAALNNAKAAAEAVYAQAELTLAQAEAELKKANANLVNAMAETEKVRAELLKVQVELAQVKVAEERVELQRMQAELEKTLAQYEADIAKAEADKQVWINKLNDLLAKAEIDAIKNAKELLKAEQDLEDYLLTQAGKDAENAKKASKKYFDALDKVQELELKQLGLKATKALVEAGALEIRDAIHYQIEQIEDQITEKEALVAYLEEYQTMTPEEAEEALKEARKDLEEAYNAYQTAQEVKTTANAAKTAVDGKTADFFQNEADWYNKFQKDIQNLYKNGTGFFSATAEIANWYTSRSIPVDVKVGDATVTVKASGLIIPDEEGGFTQLPLWNYADDSNKDVERYPNIDVYSGTEDFVTLTTTHIAPATLYYDNIQKALDIAIEYKEKVSADAIAKEEKDNAKKIQDEQDKIDFIKDSLDLSKDYIAAREATVRAAEQAYKDALKDIETRNKDILDAWRDFQKHMLTKHHDVDRDRFEDLFNADTTLMGLAKDTVAKKSDLETKMGIMEGENGLRAKVKAAFEAYAKAEGDLRKAHDSLFKAGTDAQKAYDAVAKAAQLWNPEFAAAEGEPKHYPETLSNTQDTTWYKGEWRGANNSIVAGSAQKAALSAELDYQTAKENTYRAQIEYWRGLKTEAEYNAIKGKETPAYNAWTTASDKEDEAQTAYNNRVKELSIALGLGEDGKLEDLLAAFNPEFLGGAWNRTWGSQPHGLIITNIFDKGVKFPTEAHPTPDVYTMGNTIIYNEYQKRWQDKWRGNDLQIAGTAQAALFDAVKAAENQQNAISQAELALTNSKLRANNAESDLKRAQRRLIAAFEGLPTTPISVLDTIDEKRVVDYMDDEAQAFYKKYTDAKAKKIADESTAYAALEKAYGAYFDQVATHDVADRNANPKHYSWLESSYNVDYTATYITNGGEEESIAKKLHGTIQNDGEEVPNYSFSLQYKVEEAQEMIQTVLPKELDDFKNAQAKEVQEFKDRMADIMAAVNEKKAHQTSYENWIAEREAAEADYNQALKDEFDAKQDYIDAKASYDAANAVASEGVWIYDPSGDLYKRIYEAEAKPTGNVEGQYEDEFTFVPIAKEIDYIEGDVEAYKTGVSALFTIATTAETQFKNVVDGKKIELSELSAAYTELDKLTGKTLPTANIAELNFTKNVLEKILQAGKVGLQIVVDAFDTEIAEVEEEIDLWTKLAEIYKAIMNAYLGIVDEAEVAGETGPLDGEGDDEE